MLKVLELRFNQPCLHRGISRIYILMQICKAGLPAIFFSFVIPTQHYTGFFQCFLA